MDASEEAELIERAKDDPTAFGALFDRHYGKIHGYVLRRVADPASAQDITADVFYKALKSLWQFRWRSIPFSAWLYRIAGNEVAYHFRRGNRSKSVSLERLREEQGFEPADAHDLLNELETAEREIERHARYRLVQQALTELPAKYQEVIALRFFENKKLSDIALILGKKEGTVKSLLSRGLDKLAAHYTTQPSANGIIMTNEGGCNALSAKEV